MTVDDNEFKLLNPVSMHGVTETLTSEYRVLPPLSLRDDSRRIRRSGRERPNILTLQHDKVLLRPSWHPSGTDVQYHISP